MADKSVPRMPSNGEDVKEHWLYARVEGPFSREQMARFARTGMLRPSRTLLMRLEDLADGDVDGIAERAATDPASWRPFTDFFANADSAFESKAVGVARGDAEKDTGLPDDAPAVLDANTIRAKRDWAKRFFSSGERWAYLDSAGKQRGWYSGSLLAAWFARGFFWDPALQITHAGWDSYTTLWDILKMEEEEEDGEGVEEEEGEKEEEDDSGGYEYEDLEGRVQGPFAKDKISKWVLAGHFPDTTRCRAVGDDGRKGKWKQIAIVFAASTPAVEPANPVAEEGADDFPEDGWYFRDLKGEVQGPFSATQISTWRSKGYFPDDTPCRHEEDPEGEWYPMGEQFVLEDDDE